MIRNASIYKKTYLNLFELENVETNGKMTQLSKRYKRKHKIKKKL